MVAWNIFFIIDDMFYPSHTTNWTLNITINHIKEKLTQIEKGNSQGIFSPDDVHQIMAQIAHSHHILLESDPIDFEIKEEKPIGAFLTPLEQQDTGFYLFYYPINDESEALIYSTDFGLTSEFKIFNRGTVSRVIRLLPDLDLFSKSSLELQI